MKFLILISSALFISGFSQSSFAQETLCDGAALTIARGMYANHFVVRPEVVMVLKTKTQILRHDAAGALCSIQINLGAGEQEGKFTTYVDLAGNPMTPVKLIESNGF